MNPALSYIIPAYNAQTTIGDTLRSLLAQTRPDWEAVVIDDGSTDGTAAAAQTIDDPRIRIVRQSNRGLAGARNAGIAHARTQALCFLDADDAAEPAHADSLLAALDGHHLAACGTRFAGPDLQDLGWAVPVTARDLSLEAMLRAGNPVAVGAVVVARDALSRLPRGGALFDESLPVLEDWDAWLRLTAAGARWAPPVAAPLFTYRLRPASMSQNLRLMWRTGLGVLRAAQARGIAFPGDGWACARRTWTLRSLARSLARPDPALRDELLRALGTLNDDEPELLAAAMRSAFCRDHAVPPGGAHRREAAWRAAAAESMADLPFADAVLEWLHWPTARAAALASSAAQALAAGRPVAIYGMGRNAREVLAALEASLGGAPARIGWIDDDPRCEVPTTQRLLLRRLQPTDLTPEHTVIVTPDIHGALVETLRGISKARICA